MDREQKYLNKYSMQYHLRQLEVLKKTIEEEIKLLKSIMEDTDKNATAPIQPNTTFLGDQKGSDPADVPERGEGWTEPKQS